MKLTHTLIALFISCATLAQTHQNIKNPLPAHEAIIQINDLTVDSYNALFKALERDGNFSIVTACIPAHVLHIRWKVSFSTTADSEIKKFIRVASTCDLERFNHMSQWGVQEFEQACLNARNSVTN